MYNPGSTIKFREALEAGSVKPLALPPRSPNLNAYAERWVRSVKEECLAKLILLGEGSLRRALCHYKAHYHEERNHQGKDNVRLPSGACRRVTSNPNPFATGTKLGTHLWREGSVLSEDFQSGFDEMERKDGKRSEHLVQVSPSGIRTPDAPDLCQECVRRRLVGEMPKLSRYHLKPLQIGRVEAQ
jgi:hypothetical protein